MKCYLLLRSNVESGPFERAELEAQGLLPDDLIWVEGSSQSWRFPAEMDELAHLVQHQCPPEAQQQQAKAAAPKRVFVALPPQPPAPDRRPQAVAPPEEPALETLFEQPLSELKTQYQQHLQQRRFMFKPSEKQDHLLSIAAVFVGLVIGAFFIKKMVDAAADQRQQTVAAAALPAGPPETGKEAAGYHNALTTETVPVDTTAAVETKTVKKKVNLKKLVTLTPSDYKKGVFGGINELAFKVRNGSDQLLDKVTVEVRYLKKNGDVIKKEAFSLTDVAPRSTRTLLIPPSNRGVDIKYRITQIKAGTAKADQREL